MTRIAVIDRIPWDAVRAAPPAWTRSPSALPLPALQGEPA